MYRSICLSTFFGTNNWTKFKVKLREKNNKNVLYDPLRLQCATLNRKNTFLRENCRLKTFWCECLGVMGLRIQADLKQEISQNKPLMGSLNTQ